MTDKFYNDNLTDVWLSVLDKNKMYSFGEEDLLESVYKFIPEGSNILDCGCGWGGYSERFIKDKHCTVTGITNCNNQYIFLQNQSNIMNNVILKDLDSKFVLDHFGIATFFESFTHLENPSETLQNLNVDYLIIHDFIAKKDASSVMRSHDWHMNFFTIDQYDDIFKKSGFKLLEYKIEPFEYVVKSAKKWKQNIEKLPTTKIIHQIKLLHSLCNGIISIPKHQRNFDIILLY
jgi:cyclopropane fatty-acyl-phospholipid synthase-like methyltransferase